MRLGLGKLAGETVGLLAAGAVGVFAAIAVAGGTGAVASAAGGSLSWKVTLGQASRMLLPGTDATMPFEVRNDGRGTQRLHSTTVTLKSDGVGLYDADRGVYVDDCPARWFHATTDGSGNDVDVAPGQTIHGTVTLAFGDAPSPWQACENFGIGVVVTAG